ncbi:HD domain-containing protein [Halalkalicoccus jeotgali]|uniref:Metal dependent phosphohydrolase n=1 Tax=Halalkalicoccus jeotgali (strain DSM 18796 / CECT 7217 / JCM 14584 / KCTC 4019 / B3) TaxID=795797 RepID=D8JAR2_HALJB|nr:HD domain-containing protein [Halalkalicoccus jeotgali]ADJ14784.1 metal dependent phosphohydrolase [Halalkalicoccus jeotgali B3]ELY39366.1 metal dependent phosphohydrolase [Halalkalicoccus jeotgali B3]
MKTIKDSVHDHIEVDGVARALLDTPEVQRLRHISQLGTVSLVYPSANHTRFEHSLGVYHLACEALSQLGIEGRTAERIRAAAILHDIGHGPYSHNVEDVIERHTGKYHEDVEGIIDGGSVEAVLAEYDLDPDRVAGLIHGEGQYGGLVSGELDVDRMDYLVRDAHHTGVPYGTIDHGRLVRELRFVEDELVLGEGNVQTAESLLVARALMNPTVYSHHVARIGKSMLRRGAERLIAARTDPRDLRRMDDHDLLVALRTTERTSEIARRLAHRNLFKRAVWAEYRDVPGDLLDLDHEALVDYEETIADRAGIEPDGVVLDVPAYPKMTESSTRVVVGGEIRRLDEQSPLVRTLRQSQLNQWRLGVYAPAEATERVGHATEAVLGLDTDGTLISDARPGLYTTLDRFGVGAE